MYCKNTEKKEYKYILLCVFVTWLQESLQMADEGILALLTEPSLEVI